MKHPAYHLRPNKAVDRFLLVDAIRVIERYESLKGYTYFGLGGPYLEDFRVLHEQYHELSLVSIEMNPETLKRQKFHLPCRSVKLCFKPFMDFVSDHDPKGKKGIYWLDYTGLDTSCFDGFRILLEKAALGSLVKVTLRAEPEDYFEKPESFVQEFSRILPAGASGPPPRTDPEFANLVLRMCRIVSELALPAGGVASFLPIASYWYKDGVPMLTLLGLVAGEKERSGIYEEFVSWQYSNVDWREPKLISVPHLSSKERLHLQRHLPCSRDAGERLRKILGYDIDETPALTHEQLKQYALFHRQYPIFVRAIP